MLLVVGCQRCKPDPEVFQKIFDAIIGVEDSSEYTTHILKYSLLHQVS